MISDFHCHIIPAVDDGAEDLEASRSALHALAGQGVRNIVASPHFDAFLTLDGEAASRRWEELDAGWSLLRQLARDEFPTLRLERGVELMLDIPDPDVADGRLHLAGSRFVLVELPDSAAPVESVFSVQHRFAKQVTPILAHPERYPRITRQLGSQWVAAGGKLQVNYGSVTGAYGRSVRRAADLLLRDGLVSYLATDYHARGVPEISAAREIFQERGALEQFKLLSEINPELILADGLPRPVPPLPKRRSWLKKRFLRR